MPVGGERQPQGAVVSLFLQPGYDLQVGAVPVPDARRVQVVPACKSFYPNQLVVVDLLAVTGWGEKGEEGKEGKKDWC